MDENTIKVLKVLMKRGVDNPCSLKTLYKNTGIFIRDLRPLLENLKERNVIELKDDMCYLKGD